MYATELEKYLQKFPSVIKKFDGFFACDTLPAKVKIGHFFIGNTE